MRLGIITDSHHSLDGSGLIFNHNSVLQRQFECWADFFNEVVLCAPLLTVPPPASATPYSEPFRLLPIPSAGGASLRAKLKLMAVLPVWCRTLRKLIEQVDAIHIRCPNNISIPGLFALRGSALHAQAIYTGTWMGYPAEPLTFRLQRWFLRHHFRGPVAVYGDWPNQPEHIVPSFSSSYDQREWDSEESRIAEKIAGLRKQAELEQPLKLLTVGMLRSNKKQDTIIRAVASLRERGIKAKLAVVGDGPKRNELQELARNLGVTGDVLFAGHLPQDQVREYYRQSDFVIQAPVEEGFGKVPIESFFHGVVPVLSDTNLSAEFIGNGKRGRLFPPNDVPLLTDVLINLMQNPAELATLIENGRAYALQFTLERWQEHVREMLESFWSVPLNRSRSSILSSSINPQLIPSQINANSR